MWLFWVCAGVAVVLTFLLGYGVGFDRCAKNFTSELAEEIKRELLERYKNYYDK